MIETKKQITSSRSNQTRTVFQKNKFLNFKILNQLLFILIIIIGVYYFYGTNSLQTKGFKLQELKDHKNELSAKNQNFELNIMSLSSYNNISQKIKNLKMVAVSEVDYITSEAETVAKK